MDGIHHGRRFGKSVKLPATAAIKHQILVRMLADALAREQVHDNDPAPLSTDGDDGPVRASV